MAQKNVVVVGAGVIGLTNAMLLAEDSAFHVTIIAKHFPGEYDIDYASPWAGANYAPVSLKDSREAEFDLHTWPQLYKLARERPEAGVHLQENVVYNRDRDAQSATASWFADLLSSKPWFKDAVPNFRQLETSELPPGVDSGISYTSVCINTSQYLHYLLGRCLAAGATVKRAVVTEIDEARHHAPGSHPADLVFNCTGLGAATLGGVLDSALYPARGHVVIVRNDTRNKITFISGTNDGPEETTYIMQRPGGGGTVIGGCYQIGKTDPTPDPEMGERILARAVKLCPELADGKGRAGIDVVRHGVGLRPARTGGPRIAAERRGDYWVVHCYGHGGAGYQASYGSAFEAIILARQALKGDRARL